MNLFRCDVKQLKYAENTLSYQVLNVSTDVLLGRESP